MYYGTGADIPAKLEKEKAKVRAARLEANRAMTCRQCQAKTESGRRDPFAVPVLINGPELPVAMTTSL